MWPEFLSGGKVVRPSTALGGNEHSSDRTSKLDVSGLCCRHAGHFRLRLRRTGNADWNSKSEEIECGPKTSIFHRSGRYDRCVSLELDWRICSRARISRDPRFDGKFFIAVRGSRVYCRSICPAPRAKEKNCRYFATAAAAAEAGFRPCLRCRPECSPGSPAWIGTPNTVSRALRLIDENGLDGGVESLARQLGVGSRHLRRLFIRHLGATPLAVAQTRRLQFAKKLIDETKLSMHEIAMASGFGSVRRFNAAIRKVYKRTPTQIRRLSRQTGSLPENHFFFRLRYRPPYDWDGMLAFLKPRATPGIEEVENQVYRRSISLRGSAGYFEISHDDLKHSLNVRVQFGEPKALFFIIERIRMMFDLNADWAVIAKTLRADPVLAPGIKAHPGLRIPGSWDGFEMGVRAILGQQISVAGATTLAGRLVEKFGRRFSTGNGLTHLFPDPVVLADADIGSIGLPRARARTIQEFARAVSTDYIRFSGIVDSRTFLDGLCSIRGIGKWTAQYIAMRTLGDPDAFPSGDLGLLKKLNLESEREMERRAEVWRPWRAYAAMYLWSRGAEKQTYRTKERRSPPSEPIPIDSRGRRPQQQWPGSDHFIRSKLPLSDAK
jgi:AraC family transcriptional regulator, regulatory protein of adaptative response / DNA-3-methyladenine glycosylase II